MPHTTLHTLLSCSQVTLTVLSTWPKYQIVQGSLPLRSYSRPAKLESTVFVSGVVGVCTALDAATSSLQVMDEEAGAHGAADAAHEDDVPSTSQQQRDQELDEHDAYDGEGGAFQGEEYVDDDAAAASDFQQLKKVRVSGQPLDMCDPATRCDHMVAREIHVCAQIVQGALGKHACTGR